MINYDLKLVFLSIFNAFKKYDLWNVYHLIFGVSWDFIKTILSLNNIMKLV